MFRVLDGTRHRSNARYRRISRNSVITRSWIFILVPSSGFMADRSTTSVHNKKERDRTNDERLGARTREFRGAEVVLTSEWKGKARVVRPRLTVQTVEKHKASLSSFFRPFRFTRRSNLPPLFPRHAEVFHPPLACYTAASHGSWCRI